MCVGGRESPDQTCVGGRSHLLRTASRKGRAWNGASVNAESTLRLPSQLRREIMGNWSRISAVETGGLESCFKR